MSRSQCEIDSHIGRSRLSLVRDGRAKPQWSKVQHRSAASVSMQLFIPTTIAIPGDLQLFSIEA